MAVAAAANRGGGGTVQRQRKARSSSIILWENDNGDARPRAAFHGGDLICFAPSTGQHRWPREGRDHGWSMSPWFVSLEQRRQKQLIVAAAQRTMAAAQRWPRVAISRAPPTTMTAAARGRQKGNHKVVIFFAVVAVRFEEGVASGGATAIQGERERHTRWRRRHGGLVGLERGREHKDRHRRRRTIETAEAK